MKIYKITEASEYLGVSINTLKTLANNNKINSFKTSGGHRRFRQDDLDAYMGVEKEKQEKLTVIYARCSTHKQKENLERQKDRLRKTMRYSMVALMILGITMALILRDIVDATFFFVSLTMSLGLLVLVLWIYPRINRVSVWLAILFCLIGVIVPAAIIGISEQLVMYAFGACLFGVLLGLIIHGIRKG